MRAYVHMADCLRTGGDGVTMAYGKPIFDLLAERPEQAETFQRAMSGGSAIAAQSILAAYDFSGIERLADLGGGHGLLLASVLRKYPGMQGVLFDRPEVVAGVPEDRLAACDGRIARRGWKLLRARAGRLRRLYDEAHHPRLERRALPHHPAADPRRVAAAWPRARLRDGRARRAWPGAGQDARHRDAGDDGRRQGAHADASSASCSPRPASSSAAS